MEEPTKQTEQKENLAEDTAVKEKKSMTANIRMIFYALIEAATRYREGYWREELEDFGNGVITDTEAAIKAKEAGPPPKGYKKYVHTPAKEREIATKIKGIILNKEQELVRFNDAMYKEIDKLKGAFSKTVESGFDNYATGMGLILEEYVKAKNTKEILMICALYNQGKFDHVFQELEKAPTVLDYETERSTDNPQRDIVSEETNPDANLKSKDNAQEFKSSLIKL